MNSWLVLFVDGSFDLRQRFLRGLQTGMTQARENLDGAAGEGQCLIQGRPFTVRQGAFLHRAGRPYACGVLFEQGFGEEVTIAGNQLLLPDFFCQGKGFAGEPFGFAQDR